MEKVIRVSLVFEFFPDGEHEDLFEEMSLDEMKEYALSMAVEDAQRVEPRMFDVVIEEDK